MAGEAGGGHQAPLGGALGLGPDDGHLRLGQHVGQRLAGSLPRQQVRAVLVAAGVDVAVDLGRRRLDPDRDDGGVARAARSGHVPRIRRASSQSRAICSMRASTVSKRSSPRRRATKRTADPLVVEVAGEVEDVGLEQAGVGGLVEGRSAAEGDGGGQDLAVGPNEPAGVDAVGREQDRARDGDVGRREAEVPAPLVAVVHQARAPRGGVRAWRRPPRPRRRPAPGGSPWTTPGRRRPWAARRRRPAPCRARRSRARRRAG